MDPIYEAYVRMFESTVKCDGCGRPTHPDDHMGHLGDKYKNTYICFDCAQEKDYDDDEYREHLDGLKQKENKQ